MSLTPRQRDCLAALQAHFDKHGVMPTVRALAHEIGRSKGYVQSHLDQLEDRGFIRRLPRRARAIEILKPSPVTETRAQCWRWDGAECGPQIGDAVILTARESRHAATPLKEVS